MKNLNLLILLKASGKPISFEDYEGSEFEYNADNESIHGENSGKKFSKPIKKYKHHFFPLYR